MAKTVEITLDQGMLRAHERAIISNHVCGSVLPVTILRADGKDRLVFLADGYHSASGWPFSSLGQMLRGVKACIRGVRDAENHLVASSRLSFDPDEVFLCRRAASACFVLAGRTDTRPLTVGEMLLPVLEAWKGHEGIIGAESAMEELSRQIKEKQPDADELLKLAEALELKWNRIHPPSDGEGQTSLI